MFVLETIALWAFGAAWLMKGGALIPDKPEQKVEKMRPRRRRPPVAPDAQFQSRQKRHRRPNSMDHRRRADMLFQFQPALLP